MAKITIFSTKGSQKKVHETTAKTWGELKNEISEFYDMSNLQATENVNRTDLVSDLAVLPTTDFTLFLRPVKTKSGVYSYTELREIIQSNPSLKEIIKSKYGRSYTNVNSQILNEEVANFLSGTISQTSEDTEQKELFLEHLAYVLHGLEELAASIGITVSLRIQEDNMEVEFEEDEEIAKLEEEARLIFG